MSEPVIIEEDDYTNNPITERNLSMSIMQEAALIQAINRVPSTSTGSLHALSTDDAASDNVFESKQEEHSNFEFKNNDNTKASSSKIKTPKQRSHSIHLETTTSDQLKEFDANERANESIDSIDFLRIWIQREKQERDKPEIRNVCRKLKTACMMREKWVYRDKHGQFPHALTEDKDICLNINIVKNALPIKSNHAFERKHGVFRVFKMHKTIKVKGNNNKENGNKKAELKREWTHEDETEQFEYDYVMDETPLFQIKSFGEYMKDLCFVLELITNGPAKTFCYQRLQTLQAKFKLHMLLNENNEMAQAKLNPHRDFYNVRKVDNHVHHSACMTQKHLLRFIKSRLKKCGDQIVYYAQELDKEYSLSELFKELHLSSYDLSIDVLSMHGHRDTFHRFDRFNNKYNPIGQSSLRQVFLKVDNYFKGKFLAEITREVMDDMKDSKYQYAEYRLSIYGKKQTEWDTLASWICDNNLHSSNVRWMIQIPRLYKIYKQTGMIKNFGEMLDNIFRPLFEVTIDPSTHPKLHLFLTMLSGFDTVDDESVRESTKHRYPEPSEWSNNDNPPYIYWNYYIWANLKILNQLRESRGMNLFAYRPHAGEAGDADHVASAFLLAQSINHGLTLKKLPVLQYLYYLKRVGLSMSPLSNNLLFLEYDRNPFQQFFQRGLNVTLSTDDPLMIHYTKDPLIEEYAIAAQVYKLSAIDMCEIARNSVVQSGFSVNCKKHWIGADWRRRGPVGNNLKQTNVPDIRLLFRDECLAEEENWILGLPPPVFPSISLHSTRSKHLKARNNNKKNPANLRDHMNYLVAHRTKVPFSNTSPRAILKNRNPSLALGGGRSDDYDPLGYFSKTSMEFNMKKNMSLGSLAGYFATSPLNADNVNDIKNKNVSNDDSSKMTFVKQMQNVVKKQFVLIAAGLVIGYVVANIRNRNTNDKNDDN